MKYFLFIFFLGCFNIAHCKEWKSLKAYKKVTHKDSLSPSDWLKKDRKQNTIVWQKANAYNLSKNLYKEYETIIQRRDFYSWIHSDLKQKGHEVLWPAMAYFISNKLRLVNTFPYGLFTKKSIKLYSKKGSEMAFDNAFVTLAELYASKTILTGKQALKWDEALLYKEQYFWVESIYKTIDSRSLKTIERISKGKFLYGLALPKSIRFKGDISNAKTRYDYAVNTLRNYSKLIN